MKLQSLQHKVSRAQLQRSHAPRPAPFPGLHQLCQRQGWQPLGQCGGGEGPAGQPLRATRAVATRARRGRSPGERNDFNLDSFVSFDSEDEWEAAQGAGKAGSTPPTRPFISQLFSAVTIVVDRLTDLAYTFVPEGVSVGVVRTAVSGALLLLILSFAKSALGFILTLGSLALGAYVAVRILGIDLGGMATGEPEEFKQAAASKRQRGGGAAGGRGRRPPPRGREAEFRGLLSSSRDDEEGLLDVWFERNKSKYTKRGKQ